MTSLLLSGALGQGVDALPPPPLGKVVSPTTWLCTFEVLCDCPQAATVAQMEQVLAQSIANGFIAEGWAGNCQVTLRATAGNRTVAHQSEILP